MKKTLTVLLLMMGLRAFACVQIVVLPLASGSGPAGSVWMKEYPDPNNKLNLSAFNPRAMIILPNEPFALYTVDPNLTPADIVIGTYYAAPDNWRGNVSGQVLNSIAVDPSFCVMPPENSGC